MRFVHEWRWVVVCIGLLPILMCTGCGKKPDLPDAPAGHDGETAGPGVLERRSTGTLPGSTSSELQDAPSVVVPSVQPDIQASVSETLPVPVRVAALIQQRDGSVRVGLVGENEQYALVGIGDQYLGYELVVVDVGKGEVVLQREQKRYVLGLEPSALPAALRSPDVGAERQVVSDMGPGFPEVPVVPSFEATPRERKLGIDPNDPTTWKPGYLGPGIERAATVEPQYEKTADEEQRGIDPNDPSTWPADYRGPGIERMAAQLEQRTQEQDYEQP